ncbi:MAG: response regulator [Proteobacteria bacterium]|nr:response regulator [Pseudomonadota bacterium]
MSSRLRALLVEDSEDDAALVVFELRRNGFEVAWRRVETGEDLEEVLEEQAWDVVISDYRMPRFDGRAALRIVKRRGLDIPFIIVSGTIGEDVAVEAMRAGANDYLLKDKLQRLGPAVRREVTEAARRREGRKAQRRAKEVAEQLEIRERVADYLPVGVTVLQWEDPADLGSFRFLWRNRAAEDSGINERVVGRTLRESFPDTMASDAPQVYARAIETGKVQRLPQLRHEDEEGTYGLFDVRAVPLGERLVGVIFENVTEREEAERKREEMEQQMRAAQRMEAVGRLAGGVAHDFNNVLTVIQSYAGFLLEEFRGGDPAREDVAMILEAADRAARLTNQLLAFSRRQPRDLVVMDLNETLGDVDRMLRRLIGEDVDLKTKCGEKLGSVKADQSQIEQILMNLAVNARDAMPEGGKLAVETANVELDEVYGAAKGVWVPPGRYVMLAVTDTGTGIDPETQRHVFEPFFTTKPGGAGTGLGLSTVYGIVKQSGGYIWVYSELGSGTTFKIYLPRVDDEPTRPRVSQQVAVMGGTETILVAEDEDLVRRAAVRILERAGYRVLGAIHGGDACLVAEQYKDPIHLLLTDVVMPGISGKDLVTRLAGLHPEMQVIYMSGYTDGAIVQQGVLEEGTAYVQKPFSPHSLLSSVREVLDRARTKLGSGPG